MRDKHTEARSHGRNFSTSRGQQPLIICDIWPGCQRCRPKTHRGELIGEYIPDLIVENTVVVEVKSVSHLEPVFTAQVITYLRLTNLLVGLLLNFNAPKLVDGLKRVVL
jgi:hypothetical protein